MELMYLLLMLIIFIVIAVVIIILRNDISNIFYTWLMRL